MRITRTLTLTDRERTLTFRIREMAALQLEDWLIRAGALLGAEKGDAFAAADLLLQNGLLPLYMSCAEPAEALREELLACCFILPETGPFMGGGEEVLLSTENVDDYVEEVWTLLKLRTESLRHNLRFYTEGARESLQLPRESSFRRIMEKNTFARPVNVPGVVGSVVSQGMASLMDMQNSYSFSDALDMLELLNVRNYNQWAAQEAVQRG